MSAPDHTVLQEAVRWLDQGRKVALATVIETWGSAPQPVGSQLVIDSEGNFLGSVSGGCVEGEVVCTGLQNTLQPLIRYLIGDTARWALERSCPCGRRLPILEGIDGRVEDSCYTRDGRRVVFSAADGDR